MTGTELQLLAGAAAVDLPTPLGHALGGYAARSGTSTGSLDNLKARAVVFAQADRRFGIVALDLLFATRDIVAGIRDVASRHLEIPSEHLIVSATHTHSGPASLTLASPGTVVPAVVEAASSALNAATSALQPVVLKSASGPLVGIGANRRGVDRPVDTAVRTLVMEATSPPEPVAVLFSYACHPTVLEADNLQYSADFPGAATRFVEDAVGGTAVFLQGCAGDVNPVWLDHSPREVDRLGGILGHTVAALVHQVAPLGRIQRVVELRLLREVEVEAGVGTLVDRVDVRAVTTTVELQPIPLRKPKTYETDLAKMEAIFEQAEGSLRADEIAPFLSELRMHQHFHEQREAAILLDAAPGGEPLDVEISVIRFAKDEGIVALPGEPLSRNSDQIRDALNLTDLMVVGYSNGAVGYLPPRDEFARGGYEVGSTVFPPGASEALVQACVDTWHSLELGERF